MNIYDLSRKPVLLPPIEFALRAFRSIKRSWAPLVSLRQAQIKSQAALANLWHENADGQAYQSALTPVQHHRRSSETET
jgi:hypothetical protein